MFHWVDVRAFCHATEDEGRVVAAMRTIVPEVEPRREALAGHFGNPLVALTIRTEKAPEIREFWRRLVAAIGKAEVVREIDDRIDEDGVYHLRLDKQRAYLGTIERSSTSDVIDVRAKVASFPRKREGAIRVAREFLEAL